MSSKKLDECIYQIEELFGEFNIHNDERYTDENYNDTYSFQIIGMSRSEWKKFKDITQDFDVSMEVVGPHMLEISIMHPLTTINRYNE